MKINNFSIVAVLLCCLISFLAIACGDDDDNTDDHHDDIIDDDDQTPADQFVKISLFAPDAAPIVQLAINDVVVLLQRSLNKTVDESHNIDSVDGVLNIVINDPTVNEKAFSTEERLNMPVESFRIRETKYEGTRLIALLGADDRGTEFGLYELLEHWGFRFFHPEQTYIPLIDEITIPENLDIFEAPDWPRRGFHIHTMHPLPHAEFLMRDNPQYLEYAKNLIDWHIRNKQNYMQFELLRTVDFDATVDHFRAIADYAHARGMDIGVVVTWVFMQQKAWRIVPDMKAECKEEMEANIDQLMQVPWDHINLEMGSSEFTQVDDRIQVKWMDNTVAYLAENYPDTEASVKVHCSSGQTAPHYGDINFNYLPQETDQAMGVYPHTVQFYDLQGPAPVYDNEDFSELLDWMQQVLGSRKMYYYPETAYWCSWDIDVPLFLPIYLFNRWKDVQLLADWGLDGHVNFTSGHEWGYWLNDWTLARYTWDSKQDWTDAIALYTEIFGDAGQQLFAALRDLTLDQADNLIGENLAPYIAGEDTWDELGYLVGSTTHPKPVTFAELYRMNAEEIYTLQDTVLPGLEAMLATYKDLLQQVQAAGDVVPTAAQRWYEELLDCFQVNVYRTEHALNLYQGATLRRLQELGALDNGEELAQQYFTAAQTITPQFLQLMRKREASYRYPVFLSSGWERSLTSYDFHYLWQASTGYWYTRYEKQAIDKQLSPFLDNVIDPIWFLF